MILEITKKIEEWVRRHGIVAAYAVLGMSVGALIALGAHSLLPLQDMQSEGDVTASSTAYTLSASEPLRLTIPAIDVDTAFEEPLGLNSDQTIEVPEGYEQVGWYKNGPTPGEMGPSVILGHVDSYQGPAVFYSLGQLSVGDSIYVERVDGSTATFAVTALERYEQSDFPTQLVYGDIDHVGLRLVTCSGTYDKGERRYTHNLVVYAALVDPHLEGASVHSN